MITAKNILKHELIGSPIRVVKCQDPNNKGIAGNIVDETQNMLVIETKTGEKRLPKKECTFLFFLKDEDVEVNGALLVGKPEERIKKK